MIKFVYTNSPSAYHPSLHATRDGETTVCGELCRGWHVVPRGHVWPRFFVRHPRGAHPTNQLWPGYLSTKGEVPDSRRAQTHCSKCRRALLEKP